jgi:hypothetical protein
MKGKMKRNLKVVPLVALVFALIAWASMFISGCATTQRTETVTTDSNGNLVTNIVTTKVYDPVKTEQVKVALELPIKDGIRRVLDRSPMHSVQIATYIREVGLIFCTMRDTQKFDPQILVDGAAKIAFPLMDKESRDIAALVQGTAVSLYKIFWIERFQAELPPDKFMFNVADLFCTSIDGGLKAAGKPGLK